MTSSASRSRCAGGSDWPGQFAAVDEELTGRENLEMVARLYRFGATKHGAGPQELLERFGARRRRGPAGGDLLRRDAPPARPRCRTDRPPAGRAARRADDRPRSSVAPGAVDVVDELRREGTTVLLTTQYLDEADRLAQRDRRRRPRADRRAGHAGASSRRRSAATYSACESPTRRCRRRVRRAGGSGRRRAAARRRRRREIRLAVADPAVSAEAIRRLDARRLPVAAVELQRAEPRRRVHDPHRASPRSDRASRIDHEREAA